MRFHTDDYVNYLRVATLPDNPVSGDNCIFAELSTTKITFAKTIPSLPVSWTIFTLTRPDP